MDNKVQEQQRSKKNTYKFSTGQPGQQIIISSNFDSGNIELVKQISQLQYRLAAVPDDSKSIGKKCWFYFKVRVPQPMAIRFTIQNVNILNSGYQSGATPCCVYRQQEKDQWKSIPSMFMTMNQQPELVIEYYFRNSQFTYFALTIPFSYYDQIIYLENLDDRLNTYPNIYYHREVVTRSTLGFDVYMLTISSKETYTNDREDQIHDKMFPTQTQRPIKIKKPVVFFNCRIHPGEVTASHTLNGIIQFLLSDDIRAYLLRKLFLFVIIPMANPDGVFQGNYRMNSLGTNLNRVYNLATPDENPEVFAIRSLVEYYHQDQRLQFYFDMHGHSSAKGAFIYGNALDNIVSQVESQLFCKLLSLNSQYFNFDDCSFSQKHMSMKDKNQSLTKEGCSRVVLGKLTGIVHCLTLETGIYKVSATQQIVEPQSKQFQYQDMKINTFKQKSFLDIFNEIGRQLLVSLLDRVEKNPFSRLYNTAFKNLQNLRKTLAFQVLNNQERFKMLDIKAYQKAKFISKYSNEAFSDKINKKWSYIYSDNQFQSIVWPNNFEGFRMRLQLKDLAVKLPKTKNLSQTRQEYPSLSRKLLKSMSPAERIIKQNSVIQQQFANKVIQPIQIIFTEDNQGRKRMSKDRSLTRKLLKDFSNQRERAESEIQQKVKQKMTIPVSIISQDDLLIEDFKERVNSKIQIRKSYSILKKGITRVRTDLVEDAPQLVVMSHKKLPKYTQALTMPNQEIISSNQQIQDVRCQQDLLQIKIKTKIRNFKRQILNAKFSEIRKKAALKFPEIKKNFKKDQPANLQELRKDIQAVKLISVTSYHMTKQRFN